MNPAFTRMHPTKNVIYSCTESVEENGEIVCWQVCPETGRLTLLSAADAFGTSTCYITIDKVCDEVLGVLLIDINKFWTVFCTFGTVVVQLQSVSLQVKQIYSIL